MRVAWWALLLPMLVRSYFYHSYLGLAWPMSNGLHLEDPSEIWKSLIGQGDERDVTDLPFCLVQSKNALQFSFFFFSSVQQYGKGFKFSWICISDCVPTVESTPEGHKRKSPKQGHRLQQKPEKDSILFPLFQNIITFLLE